MKLHEMVLEPDVLDALEEEFGATLATVFENHCGEYAVEWTPDVDEDGSKKWFIDTANNLFDQYNIPYTVVDWQWDFRFDTGGRWWQLVPLANPDQLELFNDGESNGDDR